MAENLPPKNDTVTGKPVRKPWSAPRLLEYGHIGKLTQGTSGSRNEGTLNQPEAPPMSMCL